MRGEPQAHGPAARSWRAAAGPWRAAGRYRRDAGGYLALIAAAWLALVLVQRSELSWYLGHEVLGASAIAPPLAVAGFSAGWLLMTLAMMLPGALPELAQRPSGRVVHAAAWAAGYLAPWLLLGFAFAAADLVVHVIVAPLMPLTVARTPALLWLAAGAHLLFRIARSSGRVPPTPLRTAVARRGGWATEFLSGWKEGLACLRGGWLLMLAVAAGGHGNLATMAAATVLMNAERFWSRSPAAAR